MWSPATYHHDPNDTVPSTWSPASRSQRCGPQHHGPKDVVPGIRVSVMWSPPCAPQLTAQPGAHRQDFRSILPSSAPGRMEPSPSHSPDPQHELAGEVKIVPVSVRRRGAGRSAGVPGTKYSREVWSATHPCHMHPPCTHSVTPAHAGAPGTSRACRRDLGLSQSLSFPVPALPSSGMQPGAAGMLL